MVRGGRRRRQRSPSPHLESRIPLTGRELHELKETSKEQETPEKLSSEDQDILNAKTARLRQKNNAKSWDHATEIIVQEYAEKAYGLGWMHHRASTMWLKITTIVTIILIILNALATVTSFAASTEIPPSPECQPNDVVRTLLYVTAILNAITAGVVALQRYLQSERRASEHESHSRLYTNYGRNNGAEIKKPPTIRRNALDVLELAQQEFSDLESSAPIIHDRTINQYRANFPDEKTVPELASRTFHITPFSGSLRGSRNRNSHGSIDGANAV